MKVTVENKTGFLKDSEGNDSSARLITLFIVLAAHVFLFVSIFLRQELADGTMVRVFSSTEIISMYGSMMGFAWTFKTQAKMAENKEIKLKAENGLQLNSVKKIA